MSELVRESIAEVEDDDEQIPDIPIMNVKSAVLSKVIDYCNHYGVEPMTEITTPLSSAKLEDLVQPWYADYCKVEQNMLFELVTAANFLNIKSLLDLTCLAVSIYIKGKNQDELRRIFNIPAEFSEEEQAQIAEENAWTDKPETVNNDGHDNDDPAA
jgi:S-phase kinase-associated protein 1